MSSNPSPESVVPSGPAASNNTDPAAQLRWARFKLILLFLAFASPVIASYTAYYLMPPAGRTNYGELLEPQRPLAQVHLSEKTPDDFPWSSLRGRWVMLTAADGADEAALERRLFAIRQVRLTTGKDMDRIERLLVIIDGARPSAAMLAQHEGMVVVNATRAQWDAAFGQPFDRILLVDPLANLMMRFPFQADPSRIKKDISKLLRASRIG